MTSTRGCSIVCCGKLLAILALLLVPVAAVCAFAPWSVSVDNPPAIAAADAPGLDIVEPSMVRNDSVQSGENLPVERQAREWTFTSGPRPSSNR